MIRCVKCGKLYDYKKYDGICPNCARYNRPDSSELEQDLHERYDSTPNVHSAQAHEEAHRRNYDKSSHRADEYGAQQYSYQGMAGEPKKRSSAKKGIIISVVTILIIVAIVFAIVAFTVIRDELNSYNDYETQDDLVYEETEGVYVEYGWTSELGTQLDEIDWESQSIYLSDEEEQAFLEQERARADAEPGCYYVLTLEIANNSEDALDLTGVTKEDVTINFDSMQEECRLVSRSYYDVIEAGDYGYVDCVFFLTDDERSPYLDGTTIEISGDIYLGGGVLPDSGGLLEFSFDDYFYNSDYEDTDYEDTDYEDTDYDDSGYDDSHHDDSHHEDDYYDDFYYDEDYLDYDYEWGDDSDTGAMNL